MATTDPILLSDVNENLLPRTLTGPIFEKSVDSDRALRKICHEQIGAPKGKGCYWDEHVLISASGGTIELPDWEWAEVMDGRIAFSRGGSLNRYRPGGPMRPAVEELIHDFNGYEFEQKTAPY